jgi:hypothetical protein
MFEMLLRPRAGSAGVDIALRGVLSVLAERGVLGVAIPATLPAEEGAGDSVGGHG